MRKWLLKLLRTLLAALVIAAVLLWFFQDKLMYFPRPYGKPELVDLERRGGHRIEVTTSQGLQTAFYLPPRGRATSPPAFVWWVMGGNGSLALDYSGDVLDWDPRFGYVFVDYPGYGSCQGCPTPNHFAETVAALAPALRKELQWSEDNLHHRSGVLGLGCAAGLIAADQLGLRKLVLCAPFTTMTAMAMRTVGWPLCYLNRHRYDNVARLSSLLSAGAEVRIFHGDADEVIPVRMSRELAARFPQIKYKEMPGSHHNEIVMDARVEIGKALLELSGLGTTPASTPAR